MRYRRAGWGAPMEVSTGLAWSHLHFWRLEARAARLAALSPRSCERARGGGEGGRFPVIFSETVVA